MKIAARGPSTYKRHTEDATVCRSACFIRAAPLRYDAASMKAPRVISPSSFSAATAPLRHAFFNRRQPLLRCVTAYAFCFILAMPRDYYMRAPLRYMLIDIFFFASMPRCRGVYAILYVPSLYFTTYIISLSLSGVTEIRRRAPRQLI